MQFCREQFDVSIKQHLQTMTKLLALVIAISLIGCKSQKETYYEANAKGSNASSKPTASNDTPVNTIYYVFENGNYTQSELEKKPQPVGGTMNFLKTMGSYMQYPAQARERGVKGEVILTVIINELGQTEDIQVKKGIGYGCDEAALNAWKKAAQVGFEPAMKGGKAVKVKYDAPVKFGIL